LRWLWAGFGLLVLLTPIGVLAPGTAWGEWSAQQLKTTLGYVPAGLARIGGAWTAAMPGYAPAFIRDPLVGYLSAGVVGAALVIGVAWLVGRLLARKDGPTTPPADTP
jgi:cobalt/nickel transport system permease protein